MPIYEYDCPMCGRFEVLQKITDSPLTECPSCLGSGKHTPVHRLVSLSAFHLKGSGWYKTDYCSKSSNGASNGQSKQKEESKGSEGQEAKPASTEKSASNTDSDTSSWKGDAEPHKSSASV